MAEFAYKSTTFLNLIFLLDCLLLFPLLVLQTYSFHGVVDQSAHSNTVQLESDMIM